MSVVTGYINSARYNTTHCKGHDGRPLEELIRRPQWVVWRLERRANDAPDAKPTKVPYSPRGDKASSTNPATWGTYAEAFAMVRTGRAVGIGYVFSAEDPFFGIDLDGCRNPETGEINQWALEIIERFDTYAEPSPSGTGIHIIGRGVKPAPNARKGSHIECYDRDRFFTMTLDPLPGYDRVSDCGDVLTTWHREVWPQEREAGPSEPIILTLEDRDILNKLVGESSGKAATLLQGDHSAYPSPSEARAALAFKCCFYSGDEAQIARIIATSGLYRKGTRDQERERKARQDAKAALAKYTGPRYDPSRRRDDRPIIPTANPQGISIDEGDIEPLTIDQLRAELAASRRREAAKDAELKAHRQLIGGITMILESDQIEAGPRLTLIGTMITGVELQAKGKEPTPDGYHMPASWIARRTGQTSKTVSAHLRKLEKLQVIDRTVKREKVQITDETIDSDGVIERETRETNGKRNYIAFPDNVISFADRIARYRRDESAEATKHGGPRVACHQHPDAGTYTEHITRCRECHEVVETTVTHHGPPIGANTPGDHAAESRPKMGIDPDVAIGRPKMGIDSGPQVARVRDRSPFPYGIDPVAEGSGPMMGLDSLPARDPVATSITSAGLTCASPECCAPVPDGATRCRNHTLMPLEEFDALYGASLEEAS